MPAVEEKKNGAPKPEKTVEKKADGEKRQRPRNRRRGGDGKKEGENGEKKPAGDKKKADGEKKQGERKPKADAEKKDGDKPKRQRNRRRGAKKAEDGEKKPAGEKKESKPAAEGEKKEGGDRRRRNRRRPRKNDTEEGGEKKEKATSEGGEKPKRRRDRRKRAAPGEKAGITTDMSEEELKGLSAIKVTNYPHFLSHKDSGIFFRTLADLLTEGVQLSYEVLPEDDVKALGEPAAAAVKKTDEEGEKKGGRSNNRRELAYKDRFDYWTSPEGAVKYRLVYLYPSAAGTVDELVKKINATKTLSFEFTERLKEITQFTHTEEKSTVELPKALDATKITWADVPSYVQKPTAKPE